MKVDFGAQWTSLKTPCQKEPAVDQQPTSNPSYPSKTRAVLQDIPQEMSQVLANRMW